MKTASSTFPLPPYLFTTLLATSFESLLMASRCALTLFETSCCGASGRLNEITFLAAHWSGPVTIVRGPGEPLHLTQTEDVEFKLDNLVVLIEGKSTSADGKVLFSALATIAYDDASHTYRSFRCPLTAFRGALWPGRCTL